MYIFKFKRKNSFFSKKIKVAGHQYLENQNKMMLYLEDGGIKEILDWKNCAVTLGADWVVAVKKKMEQQTGTSIPVNV